jgi:2-methylcitrate dehydratase PrpD
MPDAAFSFIRDFRLADAPVEAVDQAKSCLLDLIGVAAAGSQLAASGIIRSVARSQFGGSDGFLLFDGRGVSPAGAALANATTIDCFDAHDGHPLTKGHAGCGSLAGLLAFAGKDASISGAEALGHLIAGYEVAIRAGMALHQTAAEYHTSGAWVSLGAAAIGARMLGLDRAATREALGIAEYNGPRSQMMRCIDHPTMIKDGSGWGAMTGVTAVFLAREGFTGAPAVTVEGDDVAGLWTDIGARWRIREQYFKPYPVCRWAQPAMEAAAQLRRENSFGHADIEGVIVRTFHEASKLATAEPNGTDAAQYSLPFPLAALLVRGQVGPAEIDGDALDDADILRLSRLTDLVDDPSYSALFPRERWAEVEIRLADGRRLQSKPAVARGSADNPLSRRELSDKFHGLMEAAGLGDRARPIEDMVMDIEAAPSIAPLIEALMRPAAEPARLARAGQSQ